MEHRFFILLLLVVVSCFTRVSANLLVSPTRVMFDEKDRTKDIVLINTTTQERSYRIEWAEKGVNTAGKYTDILEGQVDSAASEFIRYSPRQVTLLSGERQVVKLMLRRTRNMQQPEYRSHILFTALPLRETEDDSNQEGMRIKLNVLTSYSLPVMIRTITPDISVKIDKIELKKGKNAQPVIQVELSKVGSSSASGNINVYFREDGQSEEKKVGILNGVNIFHESSMRLAELKWLEYTGPSGGTLRAEYVGQNEFFGRSFDEAIQQISSSDF
jgi:fimbrial chaperone protein